MKIYCGEKLTEMLKCRHYQTEDCDECSSEERYIKVSELRELLEKKIKTAQELMDVRKRGQGGGILLLDMAAQAEIDYCHGQIHLIEELLAELSSPRASSAEEGLKKEARK